jgi:hypothetical protein
MARSIDVMFVMSLVGPLGPHESLLVEGEQRCQAVLDALDRDGAALVASAGLLGVRTASGTRRSRFADANSSILPVHGSTP